MFEFLFKSNIDLYLRCPSFSDLFTWTHLYRDPRASLSGVWFSKDVVYDLTCTSLQVCAEVCPFELLPISNSISVFLLSILLMVEFFFFSWFCFYYSSLLLLLFHFPILTYQLWNASLFLLLVIAFRYPNLVGENLKQEFVYSSVIQRSNQLILSIRLSYILLVQREQTSSHRWVHQSP